MWSFGNKMLWFKQDINAMGDTSWNVSTWYIPGAFNDSDDIVQGTFTLVYSSSWYYTSDRYFNAISTDVDAGYRDRGKHTRNTRGGAR